MAPNTRRELREEFELNEFPDTITSALGSRLAFLTKEFALDRNSRTRTDESALRLPHGCCGNHVILPDTSCYRWWTRFVIVWAIFSSFFTPFEFGFYRGLPNRLWALDVGVQIVFLVDVIVQFLVAYRDIHTYRMVENRRSIASRYAKTSFVPDLLGCFPWDVIYKGHFPLAD
eukprot:Gb_20815 [translate_table: standard]